ncbi:MAG: polyprenyl synthetase family protein, partial [Bacteroidota bacterium]
MNANTIELITFQEKLETLRTNWLMPALEQYHHHLPTTPLFEPIGYLMKLGGKRMRPLLALAAADAFNGSLTDAMPAAMAVEVFHNFTLMHDDIMDEAPVRRGKATVHEKWDNNTAILSGDAMLVQAYQVLAKAQSTHLGDLMNVFNTTAVEVCEGQQMDMDFEQRKDVLLSEYMEMIRLKTSVLLGGAMKMGAITANATKEQQDAIYQYGMHIGIAFQLKDNYLDAFGDPEQFGKQVAGDILSDKKTYLWLKAFENSSFERQEHMLKNMGNTLGKEEKIEFYLNCFKDSGADQSLLAEMEVHYQDAMSALKAAAI